MNIDTALEHTLGIYFVTEGNTTQSLNAYLQTADISQDSVTLTLAIPTTLDKTPEEIQQELGQQLKPYGVNELNLNIIQEKSPTPTRTELPKTTGAADTTKPASRSESKSTDTPAADSNDAELDTSARNDATKAPTQSQLKAHPRIKHILVVASGKGGVGKSTTTVNVALALKKLGNKVGILDADIYGPSIPTMMGVANKTPLIENEQFVPVNAFDMPILSIGSLLGSHNTPLAWRGAKATGALMQMFNQANWPVLDYLLIDMPPGTGDIQLTMAQRIPVTASIIVTTPQHVALLDAQKGIEMFRKVSIPILGVVENMALHTCSNCQHTEEIFGSGGGEQLSETYDVPLLGKLPLAAGIREQVDNGTPSVAANDDYADYYADIANTVIEQLAQSQYSQSNDSNRIF